MHTKDKYLVVVFLQLRLIFPKKKFTIHVHHASIFVRFEKKTISSKYTAHISWMHAYSLLSRTNYTKLDNNREDDDLFWRSCCRTETSWALPAFCTHFSIYRARNSASKVYTFSRCLHVYTKSRLTTFWILQKFWEVFGMNALYLLTQTL